MKPGMYPCGFALLLHETRQEVPFTHCPTTAQPPRQNPELRKHLATTAAAFPCVTIRGDSKHLLASPLFLCRHLVTHFSRHQRSTTTCIHHIPTQQCPTTCLQGPRTEISLQTHQTGNKSVFLFTQIGQTWEDAAWG